MIGAVRECPGIKPPSYHDLRVPLLLKEVNNTEKLLEAHKKEWELTGCTLMCDGWTDRRNRTLINFLVNSPRGTVFLYTIDASSYSKTGVRLFELVSNWIERIGPKNVLQVVTDNASNFRAAGKHLEAHYSHLSWSPCAAHCMDLMLEDFGNMRSVKNTIKKSIKLSGYIYNHTLALEMMRGYTKERELIRPAKTRFATSFLTLQSIHKQKSNLKKMFSSEDWQNYVATLSREEKKKATFVERIVLSPHYWNGVVYALKVSTPLVKVLRLADSEKKPSMGYMYEAIGKAKDVIKRSFNGHEAKYSDVYTTINKRWECQLKRPLHAAGYFFNPEFFYSCPNIEEDEDIIGGLFSCIEKLVPSTHEQNLIMNIQLPLYKRAEGLFGSKFAIMNRKAVSPAEWWRTYGQSTPELRRLAIRIMSLTTSACGCERNWSVFDQIHSKKRNRLERKKLRDLVYVKYNQTLVDRYNVKDVIDPISLEELIEDSNEWIVGEMLEKDVGTKEHDGNDLLLEEYMEESGDALEPLGATTRAKALALKDKSREKENSTATKTRTSLTKSKGKTEEKSSTKSNSRTTRFSLRDEDEEVDTFEKDSLIKRSTHDPEFSLTDEEDEEDLPEKEKSPTRSTSRPKGSSLREEEDEEDTPDDDVKLMELDLETQQGIHRADDDDVPFEDEYI